jgi:hypothetical protein
MIAVPDPTPGMTPVTMPVSEPTVATVTLLLLQTPPPTASLRVELDKLQKPVTPDIGPG